MYTTYVLDLIFFYCLCFLWHYRTI